MIDGVIVIGVIVVLIKILKLTFPFFQTEKGLLYISLIMFVATGLLNVINGIVFNGEKTTMVIVAGYFKDGLILGAAASGIYEIGKEVTARVRNSINK